MPTEPQLVIVMVDYQGYRMVLPMYLEEVHALRHRSDAYEKERRENDRRERERDRQRGEQPQYRGTPDGWFTRGFEGFEEAFRQSSQYFDGHVPPPSPNSSRTKARARLLTIANLSPEVKADEIADLQVFKRAQRLSHPDMPTGSHELWLEVHKLGETLGVYQDKKPGRSGG